MGLISFDKYKTSKKELIGKYPHHWNLSLIKYETYVKARVGWHGLKSDDFTEEGPYLVTGTDFQSDNINWEGCYHCDIVRYEQDPFIQLKNGDLLITKDGTIGKVALVSGLDNNEKATLNSGIFVVKPLKENISTRYYFWLLQSSLFSNFINYHKQGSTIIHLYQDTFLNFSFPFPELKEQNKIVAYLDRYILKTNNLIIKLQKLIELLNEKRQAVISHAVTKGLNPDVPMKDSGVEWLGNVPEHWLVCPIKHILSIPITDGPHETPNFFDEGIPFISAEAISTGKIDFDKKRAYISIKDHNRYCEKYAPKINDIYMVKSGATTGVTALVETDEVFNIWSPLAAFRCKDNYIPNYVLNFFRTAEYLNILALSWTFGTQQNIGMGILKNIHITCPPIDEAKEIAAHLHHHCLKLEETLTLALKQVTLLKERRTALISAAVTGKIDLRDWTPPANSTEAFFTAEEATA
ncbi:TPA: restriction endonuclease subunit S [Enterobacter asburiae]|jgi:type I restriction enzyme S subunit|nr:restriction endonuclease subunit S [Enterobacter asburiae]